MVSHEDFASWLVETAMGWLGWSYDQAMRADCCAILLAYQGHMARLKAIYGSDEEPEIETLPAFTPGALRGLGRR